MPLDRLSALWRALVPRIGLGLTFTSRTVECIKHRSPDPSNVSRRPNRLALTQPMRHRSQPLPGLGNRLNDRIHTYVSPCQLPALPGCHRFPVVRHKPQKVSRLYGCPGSFSHRGIRTSRPAARGIARSADRGNILPANVRVPHDHSILRKILITTTRPLRPTSNPKPTIASPRFVRNTQGTSGTPRGARPRCAKPPNKQAKHADTSGNTMVPKTCFRNLFSRKDQSEI